MNILFPLLVAGLVLASATASAQHEHGVHGQPADHAAHHAHATHAGAHAATAPATVAAGHVPWTPDAPLVAGMARVAAAVDTLAHHEMGHLADSDALALADGIDAAIRDMFANCRLEPEPDAALHGVLARLMAATGALRANPADASPVAGMRAALADYRRLFADPGTEAP